MLPQKLYQKLNDQVMLEFYSVNLYLSMSAWCASKGLSGSARFLHAHAKEEMGHMEKLFGYINETGSQTIISQIDAPPSSFESLKEVFDQIFLHEKHITQSIFDLVDLSLGLKDYSTFQFLQWYTAEQHEEEALFKGIVEKFEIIGTEGRGLFMIDKEIGALANI